MFIVDPSHRSRRLSTMSDDADSIAESVSKYKENVRVEGNLKLFEPRIDCEREVMCLRYNPDGTKLAVGLANGIIKIFNPDTGQHLHTLSADLGAGGEQLPVTSIRFKPSSRDDKIEHTHILIATYACGSVKYWHYTSAKCLAFIQEDRQTLSSAIDPSGSKLVTCAADINLNIYDIERHQVIRTLCPSDSRDIMDGHVQRVFAVQYHPIDNHVLVSGGWDDTVQFWDDRAPHAIRRIYGPHICGDALDIDATHNHLITGSWRKDDVLQIWDFGTGNLIKNVVQDPTSTSLLYCCQWLGKDGIICGGTDKNMARLLDRGTLNTMGQLVHLPSGVFCIDNDRQAKPHIAVGAANSCYVIRSERKT